MLFVSGEKIYLKKGTEKIWKMGSKEPMRVGDLLREHDPGR